MSDKKFKSNHQMFSARGRGRLDTRLRRKRRDGKRRGGMGGERRRNGERVKEMRVERREVEEKALGYS